MYDLDIQLTDSSGNSVNQSFRVRGWLLRILGGGGGGGVPVLQAYIALQTRLVAICLSKIATKNPPRSKLKSSLHYLTQIWQICQNNVEDEKTQLTPKRLTSNTKSIIWVEHKLGRTKLDNC